MSTILRVKMLGRKNNIRKVQSFSGNRWTVENEDGSENVTVGSKIRKQQIKKKKNLTFLVPKYFEISMTDL